MKNSVITVVVSVVLSLGLFLSFTPQTQPEVSLGATSARTTIKNPWTFEQAVTMSSDLTVTTANTATSSVYFGCWQSTATSTDTILSLQFTASTTAPTNGSGIIPVISYGACS